MIEDFNERQSPSREASSRAALAEAVARVASRRAADLEALRARHVDRERPDFIWHFLLQSYATWGSVRGFEGLMKDEKNYAALSFDRLRSLPPERRVAHADAVLRRAKVRMPGRKAELLARAVDVVDGMGGPERASAELFARRGARAKMELLKRLPGVGAKYARNIMMDIYDSDFRSTIAVDARIQRFAADVGLDASNPRRLEEQLLEVAATAGLDGWTVDRTLFWWSDEVRAELPRTLGRVSVAELVRAVRERVPAADEEALTRALTPFRGRTIG